MNQVVHLNELNDKYFAKGLRIVAISDEPVGTIKSKLIEAKGAKYWVGSDPERTTFRQCADGSVGIPHAYLVDASGNVVSDGFPSDQQIEDLLKDTYDPALGRDLCPQLKAAQKSYEKGDIGAAWAAAGKLTESPDATAAADARFLQERAQSYADWVRKGVEADVAAKDYVSAIGGIQRLSRNFAGMEAASWAAEQEKTLNADPAVSSELTAWKLLEKAQAAEQKAEGKEKKLGPAKSQYKAIAKKYPGTRAAKMAEEALKRLGGAGS